MNHRVVKKPKVLKIMYSINVLGAGIPGFLIVFFPSFAESNVLWGQQDYAVMAILGSIWLAIGLSSILGIFRPYKFIGIFVVQLFYKLFWLLIFFLPYVSSGTPIPIAMKIVVVFFVLLVIEFLLFIRPKDFIV